MFDDSNLWCDDCQHSNTGECNKHGALLVVSDSRLVSRARQSLPSLLELKISRDSKQDLSVFCREKIKRRTRFGPLQAPKRTRAPSSTFGGRILPFKLFRPGKEPIWLNTEERNEDQSNWMVFVAAARSPKEQNLIAFQYKAGIYFVTIKDIAVGEELRVWYAKEYAACMGTTTLPKATDPSSSEEPSPSRQLRPRAERAPTLCPKCHQLLPSTRQAESRQLRPVCSCSTVESSVTLTKAPRAAADPVRRRPHQRSIPTRRIQRAGTRVLRGTDSKVGRNTSFPSSESSISSFSLTMASSDDDKKALTYSAVDNPKPTSTTELVSDHALQRVTAETSLVTESVTASSTEAGKQSIEASAESESEDNVREVFVGEWSMPGTSRHGLRSSYTDIGLGSLSEEQKLGLLSIIKSEGEETHRKSPLKSKKDIKNEENLQRVSASSQIEGESMMGFTVPGISSEKETFVKRKLKGTPSSGRHVCPVCSKAFGSPGKLGQHMYSHTGERPFECTQCNKAFSSKFKLVRHVLIHSDERRYRCTVCERTFHRKDHLKNHVKVHSPVKKTFHCEREGCSKEYSSFLSFRKHVAVHAAEEGNLECKMCGKTFATKEEIVYHLKVHAGSRTVKNPSDKKYRCDHCERKFFTRKDVRRHLVVHTGKRDFLCQFCPQRFGRKDHLVRHIKKSHHNTSPGNISRGRGKRLRPTTVVSRELEVSPTKKSLPRASVSKLSSTQHLRGQELGGPGFSTQESVGEVILLPGTSVSYPESSDDKDVLLLETRGQLEDPLKIPGVETMLRRRSSSDSSMLLKSEVPHLPPVERSSVTVHHRPRTVPTSEEELSSSLFYGHPPSVPPPPYPSTPPELRSSYKAFEHGGTVKMEFPSPGSTRLAPAEGAMDFSQFLSLMPSTSSSVTDLSETLDEGTGEVPEDLHRLLTVGESGSEGHLLVSDPNISSQFLHLMESATSSLDIPSSSTVPTGTTSSSEMMASLLESSEDVNATQAPTPLPRFTQAFQQQQQQPPP
ncbi:uncharacterized protein [Anabrus simplex]|uniref:uncharacterized protein n=1 Tax=Anabrus simplex TaxID=316456 RepID=UPI0035A3709A